LGYHIELCFNFPEGIETAQKTVIKNDNDDLLNLWFYKAAKIIQINHKWKYSRDDGFLINRNNGRFEQLRNINDNNANDIVKTRLFTTDTSDMLMIQPVEVLNLKPEGVISLAFALKRAVEMLFQVEESEIGVEIIGNIDVQNILIYESSEGSLGILTQIAEDETVLNELFKKAYELCHFDINTGNDLKPEAGPASYEDLLSYYNQRYHDQLDRYSIKEALELLINCGSDNTAHFNSRSENLEYLYDNYDRLSTMEKEFIDALKAHECRLPDKAQVNLSEIADTYASADFFYSDDNVLIFIDGNVHDREDILNQDNIKRKALRNAGYDVLVWNYRQPVEEFLKENKNIFRCKKL